MHRHGTRIARRLKITAPRRDLPFVPYNRRRPCTPKGPVALETNVEKEKKIFTPSERLRGSTTRREAILTKLHDSFKRETWTPVSSRNSKKCTITFALSVYASLPKCPRTRRNNDNRSSFAQVLSYPFSSNVWTPRR